MTRAHKMWETSREVVLLLVAARRGCQILFSLQEWVREPFDEAWRRHIVGNNEPYIRPCGQQAGRRAA